MTLLYTLNAPLDLWLYGDRLASTSSQKARATSPPAARATSPRALSDMRTMGTTGGFDVIEKKDAYELVADAPGFSPSDISVELEDKVLTIRGKLEQQNKEQPHAEQPAPAQQQQEQQKQEPEVKVWRSERRLRQFTRSFVLPENANAAEISAGLDKGVLTVRVPKLPPPAKPEPRRIAVQGAAVAAH